MIDTIRTLVGAMLLIWVLTACGTIEVDLADEAGGDVEDTSTTSPTATATVTPASILTATPTLPATMPETNVMPTASIQDAPADWQRFHDDEYGITLWHPAGTAIAIGEPARTEFSSVNYPEGIVEEQVFVARVMQDDGSVGPRAILEVKLVASSEGKSVAEMAERYSKRCPGPLQSPLQPTTINVHLSGYRYGCEGIDGMIFNEFWAHHPDDLQLLFGAAWADMSAPLADEILATVAFTG